jgi:hypothetical protein
MIQTSAAPILRELENMLGPYNRALEIRRTNGRMFSEGNGGSAPPDETPSAVPLTSVAAGADAAAADIESGAAADERNAPTAELTAEPKMEDVDMGGDAGGATSQEEAPPEASASSAAAANPNPSRVFESFEQSWRAKKDSGKRDSPERDRRDSKRSRRQEGWSGSTGEALPESLKSIWACKDWLKLKAQTPPGTRTRPGEKIAARSRECQIFPPSGASPLHCERVDWP